MDAIEYAQALSEKVSLTGSEAARELAAAIGVWRKYRIFLQVALDRYGAVTREQGAMVKALFESKGPVDGEEVMARVRWLMTLTVFEVESFYVFLKILLDRTAETFAKYFGDIKLTKRGSTHRHLARDIETIAETRGLALDAGLVQLMRDFVDRVIGYRNDAIEHVPTLHPVLLATSTVTAEGGHDIHIAGAGAPTASESPEVLLRDADRYLVMLVDCLEANRARSRCAETGSG